MIQDIFPHTFNNSFHPLEARNDDYVLCFDDMNILLKDDEQLFQVKDLPNIDLYYLFQIDDKRYFLTSSITTHLHSLNIHTFRNYVNKAMAYAIVTGYHIDAWLKINKYCGRCGHPMIHDKKERAMRCEKCGNIVYPRIMPAVIVAVKNDRDQLLVTKYAHGQYQKFALVAGFNEIGETIEETCIREVKEETGLDIGDLKYYTSQPWGFSSTLLFGFTAKVIGSDHIKLDENELRLAKWANRDDDLETGGNASLTSKLIQEFQKGNI